MDQSNLSSFGVIAERFRRAGQPEKAVTLCREGLELFPGHLSARVTLGWSLLDMGEHQEAFDQLKSVNKRAPDNLAAIRGLAELHERGIGLVFESMPDADAGIDLDPDIAPRGDFDPVMPVMDAAAAPEAERPQISSPLEDLDPIFEPDVPPQFAIEDVIDAGESDSLFDLVGILGNAPDRAHRQPLALRDGTGEERAGELHEWLSRVRERRFHSVSQLMAG